MTVFKISLFLLTLFAISCVWEKRIEKEDLFYFTNADSTLLGVKTTNGKIIVPLSHHYFSSFELDSPIRARILEVYGLPESLKFKNDRMHPAQTLNTVYDRNGKLLYFPLWYDNGADFIIEGLRRFVNVKTQKMGIVHPYGKVIIPANYDFVGIAHQGYFVAYNGVRLQYAKGGEHRFLARDSAATFECVLLNRYGEIVDAPFMSTANTSFLDQQQISDAIAAKEIPTFYTPVDTEEIALLKKLSQDTLALRYKSELRSFLEEPKKEWQIIERPTADLPYFVLAYGNDSFYYLAVDLKRELYYFNYIDLPVRLEKYLHDQDIH